MYRVSARLSVDSKATSLNSKPTSLVWTHSFVDLIKMEPAMVVPEVAMADAAAVIPAEPPEVVKKPRYTKSHATLKGQKNTTNWRIKTI